MISALSERKPPRNVGANVAVGFFLVVLALLTLSVNGSTRMYTWPWWVAQRVVMLAPLVTLMLAAWRREQRVSEFQLPGVWWWLLAAIAGVQVASALLSEHPGESLNAAILPVAAMAGVIVLGEQVLHDERNGAWIGWITAAGGVVFAMVSLAMWLATSAIPMIQKNAALNAQLGADVFRLHPDGFRNNSPLGHSNYTAGVALLVLPWVVLAAARTRRAWRWGWLGGAALIFVTLASSGSRGAVIGLAAGGGFLLVVWARSARWTGRRTLAAAVAAAVVLAALAMAVPRVRHSIVNRLRGGEVTVGDQQRIAMTQIGLAMGREHWWRGVGPGVSTRLYPTYRHRVEGGVDMALQLHSTPVQVWAETGLPGLLAVTMLSGVALLAALRAGSRSEWPWSGARRGPVVAAGASFAAYAGFALTDFQFDLPVVATLCAVDLGVLFAAAARLRPANGGVEAQRRRCRVVGATGGVLFAGVVIASVPEWRARQIFSNAVGELETGGSDESFNSAVVAAARWQPDSPQFLVGGAAAHLRLAFAPGGDGKRAPHLAYARDFLTESLTIEPDLEFAHTNLGWLLLGSDPVAAGRHFAATLRLLPDRVGGYFGLGLALLETGEVDRARDAFALEIVNDPAFLTSPAWDTEVLAPHRAAAVERAIAIAGKFAAEPAVIPVRQRCYVQQLLRWWSGDGPALPELIAQATGPAAEFFADVAGTPAAPWAEVPTPETPGWRVLRAALAQPAQRREILGRFLFVRTSKAATRTEIDVLEGLLDRHGADWRGWLEASEGRDAPFVKTYRRDRFAYTIMVRNPDLPIAHDAYLVQENRIATLFFDYVFPTRGWAPDALLMREVDRIAR